MEKLSKNVEQHKNQIENIAGQFKNKYKRFIQKYFEEIKICDGLSTLGFKNSERSIFEKFTVGLIDVIYPKTSKKDIPFELGSGFFFSLLKSNFIEKFPIIILLVVLRA